MFYVVQENIFREENYNKIFEALQKLELEYEVVSFSDDGELSVKTDRKDVFPFGSVKLARVSTDKKWYPGSFYGNNHDYEVYSEYYRENLLNWDCKICDIDSEIEWLPNELKFIRPCKDSKIFNGGVYSIGKWQDTKSKVFNYCLDKFNQILEIAIQVNSPKKIYKEGRIWIVDGKIVTSSYYKYNENVAYNENIDPDGIEFAKSMIDIYQVAKAFVMDICLTPDGWKIVEINCINCSGFYKGDLQKIIIALEDLYNPIETLIYYCDDKRHLVCVPYSISNLHKMAIDLNIKKCWFHKNHYDIPIKRINSLSETIMHLF